MNDDQALELAEYLDTAPAWVPSAEVRCEEKCLLARAWLMPNGHVVVLIHPKSFRISPQWRQGRMPQEAQLPAWIPASTAPESVWQRRALVMEREPPPTKPVVVTLCRHAQKYPLSALSLDLWEAAHDPARMTVTAEIPNVARSTLDDAVRLFLARWMNDTLRRDATKPGALDID